MPRVPVYHSVLDCLCCRRVSVFPAGQSGMEMENPMSNPNITLMTDLYELTMMQGYYKNPTDKIVVFDAFYRVNPCDGGYAICAGLEQVIDYIRDLHFDPDDIDYLRSLHLFEDDFLEYLRGFHFTGDIYAIPAAWRNEYDTASRLLKVMHAGIKVGTLKGKDMVPDQSLALSCALDREAFPNVSLDYAEAIGYLRKEAVTLPPDTPCGIVLLTYGGHPIGFAKNIGRRANNLYPQGDANYAKIWEAVLAVLNTGRIARRWSKMSDWIFSYSTQSVVFVKQ